MKILCVFGEHNYGDPERGRGYEYSNFFPSLLKLGHEVQLFDSFNRNLHADFIGLNRELLITINTFQPKMIFSTLMGYEIWLETILLIRKAGIKIINWGTDDSWKYEQFTRYVANAFDIWITTSDHAIEKANKDKLNNCFLSQWAARSDNLHEPINANHCKYDVSFIGTAYGNRPKWISELKSSGISVTCFGHGWKNGPLPANRIPEIIRQSKVSLNFGDSGIQFRGIKPYRSRQIKARIFEVPGAGGCLLTEYADGLEKYYKPGSEIETFINKVDLEKKLSKLIDRQEYRDEIAKNGFNRTVREHTYEHRFKEILSLLNHNTRLSQSINMNEFEAIAKEHRVGEITKKIHTILEIPFKYIWGKKRGPRAARRVLFELYWRILGIKTYKASGLPGRLFYRES